MNYIGLLPVLINAIQEQEAEIKTLKSEIVTLQQRNTETAVNTTTPKAKSDATVGNTPVASPGQGIVLKSPDGLTCKLLSIDNSGSMALTAFICP